MSKRSRSNLDKGKGIAFDLNFKHEDDEEEIPFEHCSICFEPLGHDANARSTVTLCCRHEFHLDCIGSAFNAKQEMQCPICRNVEPGQWLYANGRSFLEEEFDDDEEEEQQQQQEERPGLDFGPSNLVPQTMPTGSLPTSLCCHGPGPTLLPFGIPPSSSLLGSHGLGLFGGNGTVSRPWLGSTYLRHSNRNETNEDFWLSSFGQKCFDGFNGMPTNSWVPNEYDGSRSVEALRRDLLVLENIKLRNQVERSLALIACNERHIFLLARSIYDGGESSRTGASRARGRGGNCGGGESGNRSGGGSDYDGGGSCDCGGSSNGGGCMKCGRNG